MANKKAKKSKISTGEGADFSVFIRWDIRALDLDGLAESLDFHQMTCGGGGELDLIRYAFSSMDDPDLSDFPELAFLRSAMIVTYSRGENDREFMEAAFRPAAS